MESAHPVVDTQAQPMGPSARRCYDEMVSSTGNNSSAMQRLLSNTLRIRYFDDFTGLIREQLDDGGAGRCNFRPKCVAIGPRFHGGKGLERGEEIKRAAAYDFWVCSDQPFSALYNRVEVVARPARANYGSPICVTDEDFTTMLFIDGCFLLQLIACAINEAGILSVGSSFAVGQVMAILLVDIFVLENQIPWVVLDALLSLKPVKIMRFIDIVAANFDKQLAKPGHEPGKSANDYQPIHLLDLLYKRQVGPTDVMLLTDRAMFSQEVISITTASELAEAGVEICPSRTPRFADVGFGRRWHLFGRLSLPPLLLSQFTLPILLNMLAFELLYPERFMGRMSAYLGMLTTLTSGKEDVRQLRRKGIVHTSLSDQDVMKFFKKLEPHIQRSRANVSSYLLQAEITSFFKRQRPWIIVHRFVYNNLKFLIAIGSFFSVSISILKAILSLRDSPMAAPTTGH